MSIAPAASIHVSIRSEGAAAADARLTLLTALLDKGIAVSRVPAAAAGAPMSVTVAGAPGGASLALSDPEPAAVLDRVEAMRGERGVAAAGAWKPWFPVIDYSRCTNCMQCLTFCLFDVYGVSNDGKIQVQKQSNCKTECPACSRVCPEVAIMFPKYRHGPINGDEVAADDVRREAMKVDISALLGGDIYQALRDRSAKAQSRFSKERDDERALKERQNCLLKLQQTLDIPPEVLASLPSVDEIRQKADAARARAQQPGPEAPKA